MEEKNIKSNKSTERKSPPPRRQKPIRPKNRPPQKIGDNDFTWSKGLRVIFSWTIIIAVVYLTMVLLRPGDKAETEIPYTEYEQYLNEKNILSAVLKKSDFNNFEFHAVLKDPQDKRVYLVLPFVDNVIIEKWKAAGFQYKIIREDYSWWNALVSMLPWVLIFVVWLFVMRRMQGGGINGPRGIFSFGKINARILNENSAKVTFEDVAGADEAKQELREVIEFLREPDKFQRLGGKIPKGVLLLGSPGTGKTLLARAVAGEASVPFYSISGADFVEMFVGVGASRVRDLFETGKKNAPCIIFIDEIDAVGRHRGAGLGGGHDEREQTLNQLLVEMDGFEQNSGIIVVAATNRPDVLDPALLRPGRFDRQVVVDRPDVKGREGILRVHTRSIPLADNVTLETLAKGTPGLSGADLANLVNEAALLAARKNQDLVDMHCFEEAKDKVMMGTERKSLIISEKEKKVTSYHESGHVLVAKHLPDADPVHKVTIIPRGRALGVTTYLPIDEKHTYSKEYLEAMITYALGGRAAEFLIFNQLTTGAGNDIERATELARKMICEWGMSSTLGPIAYGAKEEELFLGREVTKTKNFSELTQQKIDEEVKQIVEQCMVKAERILRDNVEKLHSLANTLLEREILDGEEIDMIIRGESLAPIPKNGDSVTPRGEKEIENAVSSVE
ncbi:MAG: ATP-dependent metallopeptidase FtsH/Yme1/Tma family protein [Ignavibacteria bacterium]|nr:ATP-dependent metallopeptidase FtsH/Yme1/Tma family protein [Ignavibacteria bacterium]